MSYDDLFKPKRMFNINFEYEDERLLHNLKIKANSREDALTQFKNMSKDRKWRKIKKMDIHQESWEL